MTKGCRHAPRRWRPLRLKLLNEWPFCEYCSRPLTETNATLDHIRPRCLGGRAIEENVVLVCFICNKRKGGRTPADIMSWAMAVVAAAQRKGLSADGLPG